MSKVSKESASKVGEYGPVTDRSEELDGYTVGFTSFHEDIDGTALVKGLKDDMCQCPHWGYVIKGKFIFRFPDHDEVYETGDAFYTPPGHIPAHHGAGSELLLFSPSDELAVTEAAIAKNMQAMQGG